MAPASELCAHALAGSGVATAAAALGEPAAPPLGAPDDEPEPQAARTRMATIARAGSLRWVLIQSPPIVQIFGDRPLDRRSNTLGFGHSIMAAIECIHSIS